MANEKNLKPIQKGELSKEEAKRRGKKGGKNLLRLEKKKRFLKRRLESV